RHLADLPELMELNLQTLARIERDIQAADQDVKMLEDRKIYLQGQLETIRPHGPWISSSGERIFTPEAKLEMLKTELVTVSANLKEHHPDVIMLKREIEELQGQVGREEGLREKKKRLDALKRELESFQGRYTDKHPDVILARHKISTLEQEIAKLSKEGNPVSVVPAKPDNPAYINLTTQIESVALQIEARTRDQIELRKRLEEYQRRLERTPQVEKAYLNLARDRENTWTQYQETLKKLMEARVAEGMEQEQKAERFTIIDPAQYPERPFKPNRIAILLVSLILGIGGGVGCASAVEFMDRSVKSTDDLFGATRISVLASIPYVQTQGEIRKRRFKNIAIAVFCFLLITCGILAFHLYVMNLEVFWARGMRFVAKRFIL
ncbi:MAG: hypothetical protein GTO12_20745, partial [Proteobacteria bacterium]|nr:hypothetical protein [Pseudomonadota bacterium]